MVDQVHHVEVLCKDIEKTQRTFIDKFGFRLHCKSKPGTKRKSYVLKQESMLFVLSEGDQDTVFNVAFEVKNVQALVNNVDENDIVQPVTTTCDSDGEVKSAVIKTPVGNIVHLLLNLSKYQGDFLPGYTKCAETNENSANVATTNTTHFDYITYNCFPGTVRDIMSWYEKSFGFSRFFINDSDDENDGFVVRSKDPNLSSFAMRVTAMEYWRCSEIGLRINGSLSRGKVNFVLSEPLPGQGPNTVRTFLKEHGGPGIQHIALHSNNIIESVGLLKERSVNFVTPPAAYYSEIGKQDEVESLGVDFANVAKFGILLDSELHDEHAQFDKNGVINAKERFLMQIFTKPLFDKETFFLEIIQRCGATGFGAGNIRALWRARSAVILQKNRNT